MGGFGGGGVGGGGGGLGPDGGLRGLGGTNSGAGSEQVGLGRSDGGLGGFCGRASRVDVGKGNGAAFVEQLLIAREHELGERKLGFGLGELGLGLGYARPGFFEGCGGLSRTSGNLGLLRPGEGESGVGSLQRDLKFERIESE